MKKNTMLGTIAGLLLAACMPAHAAYLYTFTIDEVTYDGRTYEAGSVSFETPALITSAFENFTIAPTPTLNGRQFDYVGWYSAQFAPDNVTATSLGLYFSQTGIDPFGLQVGEVLSLLFLLDPMVSTVGTVNVTTARFGRTKDFALTTFGTAGGTLTIREIGATAVPEPGTTGLLAVGLAGLAIVTRRRRRAN